MTLETRAAHSNRVGIFFAVAILSVVGVIFAFSVLHHAEPEHSPSDRVKASCEREYAGDDAGSRQCQIALMASTMLEQRDDRLSRAAAGAR